MKDILDLRDIEDYRHDLKKQNMKKNGRPFILPDKIIEILARIRAVFNASFRSMESYMRIFQEILGTPRISYTSIFRRIRKIKVPEIMNPHHQWQWIPQASRPQSEVTGCPISGQRKGRDGSNCLSHMTLKESWDPAYH